MSVSERLWSRYLEYQMYNKCHSPALDVSTAVSMRMTSLGGNEIKPDSHTVADVRTAV
jgi:hypothetical protein